MNRTVIFPLFLLLAFTSGMTLPPSTSVKVICLYRMTFRPDSTISTTRQEITQLTISDSLSEFRSTVRYKADSLIYKYSTVPISSVATNKASSEVENLPRYNFKGVIVNTFKSNEFYYYGVIDKVLYYYQDNDCPVKWQILPDTARVNGYKCQKAVTKLEGRRYAAWFTREIPISSGPYKFTGLPGLVISVADATNSYKFELTKVYRPTTPLAILPPGSVIFHKQPGKLVSKREYYRSYYDYEQNLVGRVTATGTTKIDNEDEFSKSYREKLKRRNNPIELSYKNL